nr:hypothetical protein [Tanacetum cinerariifolium]
MMASFFQMNIASTSSSVPLPSNTIANLNGELKAITTRSGLVLDGPFVPMPPPFINPKEDERAKETLTDPKLMKYTIKVPPPLVHKESINMINIYNDSYEDYLEDFFATNNLSGNPTFSSHTDLNSPEVISPLSGNTTSSYLDHFLKEFTDELALITFPLGNDDILFDIESDLREIEYFLNHNPTKEMDSILEDSVNECNLANPNNDLVDTIPKMFTNEHTLDYSSPPLYDDVDDDLVKLESYNDDVYDDLFDSKEDKIKESKLLIDELDPPRSSDFLPSLEKISIPNASLILEDFNPPHYELPFHKEVLGSETLLSFSSENEEKLFNPRILTSKGVHTSLLPELSHRGPKAFKVIKIFESPMEIFPLL